MIRCIIFDNDGTLIDSEPLQHKCMEQELAKYGYKVCRYKLEELYRGWKIHDILDDISKSFENFSIPENFIPDYRVELDKIFHAELKTMPGVVEAIRQICLPICIASSGPRPKIETALKVTGLKPFFEERIFSAYEVGAWKPDPKLFWVAAEKMGFQPADCLVIEDSEVGIKGGLVAGMQVLHYNPLNLSIAYDVPQITHFDQLNSWLAKNC